jgi:hypothetical protein
MSWLARLKNQNAPGTLPTKTTERVFVGFVGTPPGHIQKFEAVARPGALAGNDPASDPDRWCWPHSETMNTAEIERFSACLVLFTDRGLTVQQAEALASMLVRRDREGDDRRVCLECANLSNRRCGAWQRAGIGGPGVSSDLVATLQRCEGFASKTKQEDRP